MAVTMQGGIDMAVVRSLQEKIQALAPEIAEEWLYDVQVADVIPIDTGALYNSMKVEARENGAAITSDKAYAPIVYNHNSRNPHLTLWFERVKPDNAVARVIERRRGEIS